MSKLIKGKNDLETLYPELTKEWHPTKNGSLKPCDVTVKSGKRVWWLKHHIDDKTGKEYDFEWDARIADRVNGSDCPYLSGNLVYKSFNDLETLYPEIAREWHPTKNGTLRPCDVTTGSEKKVWWLKHYIDDKTGKEYDFEWETTINSRVKGSDCPYLSENPLVYKGYNDLQTIHPEIAKEWHPTRNGSLKPCDVTIHSGKRVWWLLHYKDEKTRKEYDFEWITEIKHRVNGSGCPYISGKAVYKGYNDLETLYPEIAKEWHPTRNGSLRPCDVTAYSNKKVWWLKHYIDDKTGKEYDFEWIAGVAERAKGNGCPYLCGKVVYKGFNDLETLFPETAKEWHPTRNGNLRPCDVTAYSSKKVWWLKHYIDDKTGKEYDFEWEATIAHRVDGSGCPYLSGSKAERFLYSYFKDNNITFRAEKKFTNELWIKFYPYDFYLHKEKLIVEADGIQHFKWVTFFTSTENEFKDRVKTDNLKNTYCLQYRIPILRIPYIYSVTDEKDKIESLVNEFIKTRKVPQEILDFYKTYRDEIGSNYYDVAIELNKLL